MQAWYFFFFYIVRTSLACLSLGNRFEVLCSTRFPPQNTRKRPKRVEPAHLLLHYDLTIRRSMFFLKKIFKKE